MTKQRQILVLGGSFNPPTLAHEAIIAACLALPGYDEVWLVPSGDRLDKIMAAPDEHRLNMAKIVQQKAFGNNPRIRVTDFELQLPRPTETYQTAEALARAYPNDIFCWVFGADAYADMPNWHHGDLLRKQLVMLLFDRGGHSFTKTDNVRWMPRPDGQPATSSTAVRAALAAGRSVDGLVSPAVLDYIVRHHLYGA